MGDYFQKTGLLYLVWFPFIDDIFFICTGNKDSLDHSISLTQNYCKHKHVKSKIKLKMYLSTNEFRFLDVAVFIAIKI